MKNSLQARIWIALVTVYIVWGSTYLAIRFAVETMPPFLMAGVRFTVAGLILYTWRRLAHDRGPAKIEWRSAIIIGFFLLVGGNGSVVWAEQHVPSGIAALIVGSAPLWMVVLDAARPGGHRPNGRVVAGVLIGFIGIVLLIGPGQLTGSGQNMDPLGVAALLLAAFMWAVGSLYGRNAPLPRSPLLGTGMEMLAGGGMLLVLGTITGEWSQVELASISTRSWLGLVYLIIFGALIGFAAYTWLLRVAPTPLVSTYAYVNPLIAILLGSLLADETLSLRIVISALVIVSSVALINTSKGSTIKQSKPPVVTNPTGDT